MPGFFRFPFFSRRQIRRDIDRELGFHLEERVEELQRLGVPAHEARAQADQELGDADEVRSDLRAIDERIERRRERGESLAGLRQDITFALRSLRRSPGLTAGIIVTLALGLGVNLATFSFLDAVFLRMPTGVTAPEQVRRPWEEITFRSGAQFWSGYSWPQYEAMQGALDGAVRTATYRGPDRTRVGRAGEEQEARVTWVTASYFDLLGVRPQLGRFFREDEDRLGAGVDVAVISHAFWQRQFAGDPSVLGRDIVIAGRPYAVTGVASPEFHGVEVESEDIWVPIATVRSRGATPWWRGHSSNGFQVLLRPPPGMGDGEIEQRVTAGLLTPEARRWPGDTAKVVRLGSIIRAQGPGKKQQEVTIATRLAGVTAIVLVIACANVVNLLLARAVRRRREIAVRLAMGISRARLVRLLITESVMLFALAMTAAVIAAWWGSALLRSLLLPGIQWGVSPLQWRVVAVSAIVALVAGILAGLVPAAQALQTRLTGALKAGSGSGETNPGRARLRGALVIVQAALSVVLLVGAGLFVRSLGNVQDLRIGFDAAQLVIASIQFGVQDSLRDAREPALLAAVAERLGDLPGVERVALVSTAPKLGISFIGFYPDVDTTMVPRAPATFNAVSPGFFGAAGMRILRGTGFPDVPGGAMPRVVVVNEAMAKAQWPGEDALGRCLRFDPNGECYRVAGIVETAMVSRLMEKPEPQFYLPLDNMPIAGWRANYILARVNASAREPVAAGLRNALGETFPGGRPSITTLDELLEPEYRPWRLGATLFTAFGVLALIVAAVGIYSTVAYGVAQRTHEFGVRSALGARVPDILGQVIGGSLRTVAIGVAVGVTLAIAGGRFVAALLYDVRPGDPLVVTGVVVVLLLIAGIAAFGPAWRAATVDPIRALRVD